MDRMISARSGLEKLKKGNRRFKAEIRQFSEGMQPSPLARLAEGQAPFAAVLACSDSRVPVETIFGQGPGDLFVVRVAGNLVASTQLASIEFAVEKLGTRLVIVLGHTHCGAVQATLEAMASGAGLEGPLVSRIRPALEGLPGLREGRGGDRLLMRAVRANVASSVSALKERSALLQGAMKSDGLQVVGAEYDLETGAVVFL
jgi:carbonic anhydrase